MHSSERHYKITLDKPESKPSGWETAKNVSLAVAGIVSSVAIPLIGYYFTSSHKKKDIDKSYVDLGIKILLSPVEPNQEHLRAWAFEIVQKYSPTSLPDPLRTELLEGSGFGAETEKSKNQLIESAKEEIWFIGATMHITATKRQSLLVQKLREGVDIKMLIADPEGELFDECALQFSQAPSELRKETDITLKGAAKIIELRSTILKANQGSDIGEFEIRLLDHVFPTGLYLFDPNTPRAHAIVVPHGFDADTNVLPSFQIGNERADFVKQYRSLIDEVWKQAKQILR